MERDAKLLDLCRARVPYEEVAEQLGYKNARTVSTRYHKLISRRLRDSTDAVIDQELDMLDAMANALWPKVAVADIKAVEAMLKVQERRAKYKGLDAAIKVDASVSLDADREALLAAAAALPKPRLLR